MTSRRTPAFLEDVLGERFGVAEVVAIGAFGLAAATAVMLALSPDVATWRWGLAWLVITDVAAGALANFTRGTNDYYAERPGHRLIFIAVHVHVLVVAYAVGAPLHAAAAIWAYTVAAAFVVNAAAGRASQRFIGALALVVGLVGAALSGAVAPLVAVYALFVLKVAFAFAVDHEALRARTVEDGVVPLTHRDRERFINVVAAAFASDPLFVAVVGRGDPAGAAARCDVLAGALFDMHLGSGARPIGLVEGGDLVAVALVEAPTRGRLRAAVASLLGAIRFALSAWPLGPRALRFLNTYFVETRACAPAGPHHTLSLIAVAPKAQGRGLGRRLVDHVASLVAGDPSSQALVLDTENEQNIARYERWGFSLAETISVGDVTAHVMIRPRPPIEPTGAGSAERDAGIRTERMRR